MTNLDQLGIREARSYAMEQLVSVYTTSGDLRWALVALMARSVTAAWSLAHKRVREAVRRVSPAGPLDGECHCC